jgi:hypothetical protein
MALTLLQPGMEPLGQFDLADGASPVGGEVATFGASAGRSAADGWAGVTTLTLNGPVDSAPALSTSAAVPQLHGLVDEGATGYGTLFGTVIGGTAGQGTGFGTLSTTGVVVVGPNTSHASGKVTLWDKPGLYGASQPAWAAALADGAALNSCVFGAVVASATLAAAGQAGGVLCVDGGTSGLDVDMITTDATAVSQIGLFLGSVNDTSLVSTTSTLAGTGAATNETHAIYYLGNGGAR